MFIHFCVAHPCKSFASRTTRIVSICGIYSTVSAIPMARAERVPAIRPAPGPSAPSAGPVRPPARALSLLGYLHGLVQRRHLSIGILHHEAHAIRSGERGERQRGV